MDKTVWQMVKSDNRIMIEIQQFKFNQDEILETIKQYEELGWRTDDYLISCKDHWSHFKTGKQPNKALHIFIILRR